MRVKFSVGVAFFIIYMNGSGAMGKRQHYCDYTKNVYYSEAVGGCKKCDPCFQGWGLVNVISFEIDTTRGALGCRICRPCKNDTFQKRYKAFRICKKCKVCKSGEKEVQQCTGHQNRKCKRDKNLDSLTSTTSLDKTRSDVVPTNDNAFVDLLEASTVSKFAVEVSSIPNAHAKTGVIVIHKTVQNNTIYFVLAAVFLVVLCFVVVCFAIHIVERRKKQQKELQSLDKKEKNYLESKGLTTITDNKTLSTSLDETVAKEMSKSEQVAQGLINTDNTDSQRQLKDTEDHQVKTPCISNRKEASDNDSNESSLPLLSSSFKYSLQTFQNVSSLKQDQSDSNADRNGSQCAQNTYRKSTQTAFQRNIQTVVLDDFDYVSSDGNSLQMQRITEEPMTPKALQKVAHQIAAESFYMKVGRELGLTNNEIGIIKSNHPDDVEEAAYYVLKKWTEKAGCLATNIKLQEALTNVGRDDVADFL